MEISGTGISDDRIAALEKRLREMEALVKGLIEELLDFKSISMTMSRQTGESGRQVFERESVVPGTASPVPADPSSSQSVADPSDGTTVIRPMGARQPDVPAEPVMVRIMQSDGTMKLEIRCGDKNPVTSSTGYRRTKKGTPVKGKQSLLI
jgi:hypothetical protein